MSFFTMPLKTSSSASRYSILRIEPATVSPQSDGTWFSGQTLTFLIPPSKVQLVCTSLAGFYAIYDPSMTAHQRLLCQQFFALSPTVGAYGLFTSAVVKRAFSAQIIEALNDIPNLAAAITATEHGPNNFINHSCGCLVEPSFSDVSGRSGVGHLTLEDQDVPNYWRDFYYQPLFGCLNSKTNLNVGLAGGVQFEFVTARFSESCSQWLPWSRSITPEEKAFAMSTSGQVPPQNNHFVFAYAQWAGQSNDTLITQGTVPQIVIRYPVLWALVINAGDDTSQTFVFTSTQMIKNQLPKGPNIILGVPISYLSIKSIQVYMKPRFSLEHPEICNLDTVYTKVRDMKLLVNGTPQFYAYPTGASSLEEQISPCTTNTMVFTARSNIYRLASYANMFNGAYWEGAYDFTGNGAFFDRTIFTIDIQLRNPDQLLKEVSFPYMYERFMDTHLGPCPILRYDYVGQGSSAFGMSNSEFIIKQPLINLSYASSGYSNNVWWRAIRPAFIDGLLDEGDLYTGPGIINNIHMKRYQRAVLPTNLYDMMVLIRSSFTLTLSSTGSQRTGDVPLPDLLPTELQLQNAAGVSSIKRIVRNTVVGQRAAFSDQFTDAWTFQLPESGVAGRFVIDFEVDPVVNPNEYDGQASNLYYNRLALPSVTGAAAFFAGFDITLEEGVVVQRRDIMDNNLLEHWNSTQNISDQEFTRNRTNGWYKSSTNYSRYIDILPFRSLNHAADCVNTVFAHPDDCRLTKGKRFQIDLGGVDEIFRHMEGILLSTMQKRFITIYFDKRGLMANIPCGRGCGQFCEADTSMWTIEDDGLAAYIMSGYKDVGNANRLRRVCPTGLTIRGTPLLHVEQLYHNNEMMAALETQFKTEGTTFHLTQFNFTDRHAEIENHYEVGRIPMPIEDQLTIGPRNPAYITCIERPGRQIDGVFNLTTDPSTSETVKADKVSELLLTNPFSVMRDGPAGASFAYDYDFDSGKTASVHSEYMLQIDSAAIHPFNLGAPCLNALMYAIAIGETIALPHFMISNQSDVRITVPNQLWFKQTQSPMQQTLVNMKTFSPIHDWIGSSSIGSPYRATLAPPASRYFLQVPIPPAFQYGLNLTVTQKTNISENAYTPAFWGGNTHLSTEGWNFIRLRHRRWAVLEAFRIHFSPTEARIEYLYPTGYKTE